MFLEATCFEGWWHERLIRLTVRLPVEAVAHENQIVEGSCNRRLQRAFQQHVEQKEYAYDTIPE